MKLLLCVCIAFFAAGAIAEVSQLPEDAVVPEVEAEYIYDGPGSAPEEDAEDDEMMMQMEASFSEAKDTVTNLLQAGKDDAACRTLAKATAVDVNDSVAASQKAVANMPNGAQCNNEGQPLVKKAESNKKKADKAEKDALSKLNAAKNARINFGDYVVSSLDGKSCSPFFNSNVWRNAKSKITAANNVYNKKKAEAKAAVKAVADAKAEAAKLVQKCKCNSKKAIEKAIKDINNKARSANQKAWNKSYHMLCVLDKKPVNGCSVPKMPEVKPVPFAAGVANACSSEIKNTWNSGNMKTGGRYGHQRFKLVKLSASTGWTDNRAGMDKYVALCKSIGYKVVGCGTHNNYDASRWSSHDSIAMPSNWGCNMLSSLKRYSGFGNSIFALQERLYNGAALYAINKHGSSSQVYSNMNLHPICGKHY